jgi:hypothetical protein
VRSVGSTPTIFVDLIEKAHRFKHGNSGEKQATIVMIACLQMYFRSRPPACRKGDSMMSFALDFVFVAIGAAAFAVTALYLNACARL